ncbi:D-alanyl-D-alanine carboxypeptidase family protein [Allobacillus sp. GCM10007491]|uniref:D-alanyl-D-alanine carboxypeptidase n=1 Tax=Allobacillus saliphilus TaxID=2912308 RepID=A0A941CVQ6_9BACI|nr:D-alanyl-D-alanine carboxypeptidase family protein [Allobacillus saliphilus]MBR7553293.1 D-alanyl-D-alanine carboxypeptidase [Allobacillus saliphilus]
MKKLAIFTLLILLIMLINPYGSDAAPDISAEKAVVLDMNTMEVLYGKQMNERSSIASITKIVTAFVALEYGDLDDRVRISKKASMMEGSSIYTKENQLYTLEDLIYGLMLRSGNDAATAIAEHVGGSVEGFAFLMNETADWIGMENSSFKNSHGLEEENHYSSAYDMALITAHAMNKNDQFKKIFGTEKHLPKNGDYYWFNKNKLLTTYGEYCTGGKTGFTKKAGRTLVTTAEYENKEIVVVTLNASDDWNDHKKLYDYAFQELAKKPNVPIQAKANDSYFIDLYIETFRQLQGASLW